MSAPEHRHVFERATLRHADGTPMEDGRRCRCGMEVVGDGPFAVNANLVRASREFNRACTDALTRLADAFAASHRRMFP